VSFVAIIICVASQRVFIVYFVIDSVRKLLDTSSWRGVAIFFMLGTSECS
jgi:hypothetical protein